MDICGSLVMLTFAHSTPRWQKTKCGLLRKGKNANWNTSRSIQPTEARRNKSCHEQKKKCILLNYTSLSAAYYVFSSIVKVNLRCSLDFRNIQTLVMHIRHLWMRGRRQGQQNGRIKSAAVCHLLIWHIVGTHAQCTPFGMTRLLRNMQTKTVAGSARSWQLRLINLCSWCNGDSTLTT